MFLVYRWVVDVAGASGTLYEGETFKLQFKFGSRYPFDSPEVCVKSWFFIEGTVAQVNGVFFWSKSTGNNKWKIVAICFILKLSTLKEKF